VPAVWLGAVLQGLAAVWLGVALQNIAVAVVVGWLVENRLLLLGWWE
jgi:hypothetical protein